MLEKFSYKMHCAVVDKFQINASSSQTDILFITFILSFPRKYFVVHYITTSFKKVD